METLKDVKNILRQGDYMCKIDLKDAYYHVPLHPHSRKFIRFRWKGKLYEGLCLMFGLGPAPRKFTKLLKVVVSMLRKLNVRLVIYIDDIILIGSTIEELVQSRDTTLFILQALGFTINWRNSVLDPSQLLEFLGVLIGSIKRRKC